MWCLWSPKGGVGTTVCASALATAVAREGVEVLLVDLGGDVPAVGGLPESRYGVTDWLAADDADPGSLRRLEMPTPLGVTILPLGGATSWPRSAMRAFFALLDSDDRQVVVDAGTVGEQADDAALDGVTPDEVGRADLAALRREAVCTAQRSLACLRPCYLGLRRMARLDLPLSGVVVIGEAGRSLDAHDVEAVVGAPAVARVDLDPAVARSVDAGMFFDRPPRGALRQLRRAVA